MGLMALPAMLKSGYPPSFATGTIAATGTLGQIIPPSIALVLLGDVLGNAYQQAQLDAGVFAPDTVSVGDLFAGALLPGLLLVGFSFSLYALRANLSQRAAKAALQSNRSDQAARPAEAHSDRAACSRIWSVRCCSSCWCSVPFSAGWPHPPKQPGSAPSAPCCSAYFAVAPTG